VATHTSRKKPAPQDWHPADIKAALEKRGLSLRRLGIANGFLPNSLNQALRRQWPNAERVIAAAIGKAPHEIWPSRYERDGRPKRKRWDMPFTRPASQRAFTKKPSTGVPPVNVYAREPK
jgi:Ner family transcriptional regulator